MRLSFALMLVPLAMAQNRFSPAQGQNVLRTYCSGCHGGNSTVGRVVQAALDDPAAVLLQQRGLMSIAARVREGSMPPGNRPTPTFEQRLEFLGWIDTTLKLASCANGIQPAPARIRRMTREEYSATIRDLLHMPFDATRLVPSDPSRANEFDNSTETLNLSPMLAERYIDAAFLALDQAIKDPQARATFLVARPDAQTTPEQAARKILAAFLPLAFRRPSSAADVERYLGLFTAETAQGESFDEAILHPLQAALASPRFLFLMEDQNAGPESKSLDGYELAARLSYFLWGSMPDQTLFDLSAQGKLNDTATLTAQVDRMIRDPKASALAERFAGQWLGTRELGEGIKMEGTPQQIAAVRAEPVALLRRVLTEDLSLLKLLEPPGILSMPAAQAVTSRPGRNATILRGKWVMETFLGTPVPPAPHIQKMVEATPNQRMLDTACADCHSHIDAYGVPAPPISREQFASNLVRKMYTYALGRALTPADSCAADGFLTRLAQNEYRAQTLIRDIVLSIPFRAKGVTVP